MAHPLHFSDIDFATAPFLVIWEITQACPLACRHCRAAAELRRHPGELTTEEGKRLLDAIADMGTPVVVLTGGDPMQRADLPELIAHGASRGLRVATIPVASERLEKADLVRLRDAGVAQLAFSIDGSTAALHDDFRQVPGTFERTVRALGWAREASIPTQVNTVFSTHNQNDIAGLLRLVESLGVVFWECFSLVPMGRGKSLGTLSAEQHERLFAELYALSARASFLVKVTEAPHYRRYVLEQRARERKQSGGEPARPGSGGRHRLGMVHEASGSAIPAQLSREMSTRQSLGRGAQGINAGKGFCFVSHTGDVMPSGFFPEPVGNVREHDIAALYRTSELFVALRDPDRLEGRCGRCEYRQPCGGSRARALALTGNPFAEDAACLYQPKSELAAAAPR